MKLIQTCTAAFALILAPAAAAQSLDGAVPRVADPGDTIRLEGTNLGAVTRVRFTAVVGGFVGQWTKEVAPNSVAADEVVVEVPFFNSFTPPDATPPGQLVGSVRVLAGAQISNAVDLGYLESTFGAVTTLGDPGSDPVGLAPRIEFDLFGGVPVAGNGAFQPRVVDTLTGALSFLVVGLPLQPPYPQIANADVIVNPVGPLFFFNGVAPLPPGDDRASLSLPLDPSLAGATLAMQWITLDATSFAAAVSDALVATL